MKAKVIITLKSGLLDAQGKTIKEALASIGFKGVNDVRVGKYLEMELNPAYAKASAGRHGSSPSAQRDVERMCQKLLANPVIETYRVELAQGSKLKAQGSSRASSLQPRARAKRA